MGHDVRWAPRRLAGVKRQDEGERPSSRSSASRKRWQWIPATYRRNRRSAATRQSPAPEPGNRSTSSSPGNDPLFIASTLKAR